jgi:hypothetical protein
MPGVSEQAINVAFRNKNRQIADLLFFSPEKVAIMGISGSITTNLGKTATRTRIIGRKKTDTSLQKLPFSLTGEGHFF